LPPIGPGRPFADLVAYLDASRDSKDPEDAQLTGSLARLTVEVRTTAAGTSAALRLASWFTREPQPVDADRILSDLQRGVGFADLELQHWSTPEDLRTRIFELLEKDLGLNPQDLASFNPIVGLERSGYLPLDNPDVVERFQLLSPSPTPRLRGARPQPLDADSVSRHPS
jgi:hypothetical protein